MNENSKDLARDGKSSSDFESKQGGRGQSHRRPKKGNNNKKQGNNNPAKPGPAYGTDQAANPGDGEVWKGGKGSTGEMEDVPAAEPDARNAYKQDPAWAQTNPSEYANSFVPAYSNYDQVIRGSKFPWYLSEWNGTTVVNNQVINVYMDEDSAAESPYQFFICDVGLCTGECWHPEEYGAEFQPFVYIGKLLYQSISARKRNALPVDSLSISAYLMAFQSIVALRSYIRLVLKICSITECSEKNAAKRPMRMLRALFTSELAMLMAIGQAGASNTNDYWKNAVGALNSIDGMMNQCMSPPDLPLYKRADYLFSHVISEYSDDEMSNFYIMRPKYIYRINWVGDENGTYLEAENVGLIHSLSELIGLYRSLVSSFTGGAFGADDPNHIQAGLKYVFANKIRFHEWESTTYQTADGKEEVSPVRSAWSDILASGVDCHTWLHNAKQLDHRLIPYDISYDENFKGLRQHYVVTSLDRVVDICADAIPTAWDFEFGNPSADDLYESSTLTALAKHRILNNSKNHVMGSKSAEDYTKKFDAVTKEINDLKSQYKYLDKGCGSPDDKKANHDISVKLRELRDTISAPFDFSIGTEVICDMTVYRVNADMSMEQYSYRQAFSINSSVPSGIKTKWDMLGAFANFKHRPLQYLTYTDNEYGPNTRVIMGINYDTYALCPIRENDIDRMHYTAIKSYFGISNKDTLSWITPTTAYSDLDNA